MANNFFSDTTKLVKKTVTPAKGSIFFSDVKTLQKGVASLRQNNELWNRKKNYKKRLNSL